MHGLPLPLHRLLHFPVPLLRKRHNAALRELTEELDARVVQPQLDDRQVRMRRLQIILQCRAIELQLGCVEFVKRVAEVHQHQVALVSQHGVHRALSSLFARRKRRGRLACNLLLARGAELAPLWPAKTEHLMQHAQALKGERHGWQFGGHSLYSGIA